MARPRKPYLVTKRKDSPYWHVEFGKGKGQRESLGIPISDREAAEREAATRFLARSGRVATPQAASVFARLSMAELVVQYVDHLERTYTGKDPRYAKRKAADLADYVAGRWPHPRDVTPESWERTKLELHHSRGGSLKWRSIAHLCITLTGFLRWCAERGVIPAAPALKPPGMEQQRLDAADRRAMTAEEKERFLSALLEMGERRAWRIYTVLFESWQRKSTVEALTPRWCDFRNETIRIPPGSIKNKREVVIDLTPACAAAIKEELAERGTLDPDVPVFGRFDFHQSADRKGGLFGRALAKAGIDPHGLTPHHSTRHTAATLAGEQDGASLVAIMSQGAWRTASIPQRYLHSSVEAARKVTRATGKGTDGASHPTRFPAR